MPPISRFHFSSRIVGVRKWLRRKKSAFGVTRLLTPAVELAVSTAERVAVWAGGALAWPLKYREAKPVPAAARSRNSRRPIALAARFVSASRQGFMPVP